MVAAPTMVKRLVEWRADCNPERIRTIIWGGAPMYVADALKAIERFGPRFAQIYGQGEAPMTITALSRQDIADRDHPRWAERLGSAGRAYACSEVPCRAAKPARSCAAAWSCGAIGAIPRRRRRR